MTYDSLDDTQIISEIHKLDNFDHWFTLAEALAPLLGPNGETLLPFILSPNGFSADMGVKIIDHDLPSFRTPPRTVLEPGWTKHQPNVCAAIQNSFCHLGVLRALTRPYWLDTMSENTPPQIDLASMAVNAAPEATASSSNSRVGESNSRWRFLFLLPRLPK